VASIDDEIQQAIGASCSLIQAYLSWFSKIRIGAESNMVYRDLLEFVNFRVETADSCLHLIENKKIADSLGLCRGLFENYMLLILMCRGRKYFRVENQESKNPEEFAAYLAKQQAELERLRANGEADALYVAKYSKAKRSLMYVFEGLTSPEEPEFFIPAHYFQFQDFMPEALRLRDEKYFEYYPAGQSEHKMRKDRRREADSLYHRYLSYDGLCVCLELNEILDDDGSARLDAHYTFLGKFLHPTHNAARTLHIRDNYFNNETAIGMSQEYASEAILLAALYVAYLLAGIFDEIGGMVEGAPNRYIECAATDELRALTEAVPHRFPYFWFLFNRPPLWDKFNYAIHHIEDKELADYGGYENVPDPLVPFDSDIYRHLESAVSAWSNNRVGGYRSPLPDRNAAPKFIFGYPVRQRE
jgi:hypothetical protein